MVIAPEAKQFSAEDAPDLVSRLGHAHAEYLANSGRATTRADLERIVLTYERAAILYRPKADNVVPIAGGFQRLGDITQRIIDDIAVKRAIRQSKSEGR